jgi:hypothetical protein
MCKSFFEKITIAVANSAAAPAKRTIICQIALNSPITMPSELNNVKNVAYFAFSSSFPALAII